MELFARKLSTLKIEIVDKTEARNPIPGVLIFLSSTSRKNYVKMQNYTNKQGIFFTSEIMQGEYIIRAVLKEYVFSPSQTSVVVREGQSEVIQFVGEQVAFSIYGRGTPLYLTSPLVSNLDGKEISKVTIDATPDAAKNAASAIAKLPTEMAITDEKGNFRIRGLNPNLHYNL